MTAAILMTCLSGCCTCPDVKDLEAKIDEVDRKLAERTTDFLELHARMDEALKFHMAAGHDE